MTIKTKQELYDEIWLGEAGGLSEEKCINAIGEYGQLLDDLINHRITPRSIVGTGYKQPREVAFQWLARQIVEYSHELVTHGLKHNAPNVEYRFKQQ